VTGGDIRLKGMVVGSKGAPWGPDPQTSLCWTLRAKHWWAYTVSKGLVGQNERLVGKLPSTLYGKNALNHHARKLNWTEAQ